MGSTRDDGPRTRLPALGRRGEGWVAGQVVLLAAVVLSPLLDRGSTGGVRLAVGGVVLVLGLLLLGWAGARLGSSLTPFPAPRPGEAVKTAGPYALVRHPMYGGAILVALGWSIGFATVAGLVLTAVLAVFFDLKARREEAWLRERLPGYSAYCSRTRRKLVPFLY